MRAFQFNRFASRYSWVGCVPALVAALITLGACESETPDETVIATGAAGSTAGASGSAGATAGAGGSGGAAAEAGSDADAAVVVCNDTDISEQNNATCSAKATDYMPAQTATDTWAACISDDNQYHPFDPSISSIARVGAFVQISKLLSFGTETVPTVQDFIDARLAYQTDEGLESRVSRREDEHYAKAPDACNKLSADDLAKYPDRCVGPAKIQPLLNTAFQQGITGVEPLKNAARIEAALLWFLYMSVYKEAKTCATTAKDCDSSYAYYSGGEPRTAGVGFASYVKARSPQAHDRVWDGILATRCWRDLDNPTGAAANTVMQDLALAQLDQAALRGVALIVRQRAHKGSCEAAWETVKILGPVLGREAAVRDSAQAAVLTAQFAKASAVDFDVNAAVAALDAVFPCP